MSELGELFKDLREERKEKRAANKELSVALLQDKGVSYKRLSDDHLRVGEFDYWPSTGLFMHTKTKKRGRGVFNLLKLVGVK